MSTPRPVPDAVQAPRRSRDYDAVVVRLASAALGDAESRMRAVADALWDAFCAEGYSWVGFYLDAPEAPEGERLVLGPMRDKPACSPIGLHGVCGQAFTSRESMIIPDVLDLGDAYVACDPRDRSEIVLPVFDDAGACIGVLDIDSWEVGSFDDRDEAGLVRVLQAAGLKTA